MTEITHARWSVDKANQWYESRPWLCGFNYLPSTAVNSTEMWKRETFDPETIQRELGWAQDIGFNCCRVFVQYLVWGADPDGLADRLDQFLQIADDTGITTLIILFDDCAFAGKEPYLGPQAEPVSGVHNSGWTPSPGPKLADDPDAWPRLRAYVTALISRFGQDKRVLGWDIYNEPGNEGRGIRSLPLLKAAFEWAREAGPSQPLTSGIWVWDDDRREINDFLLAQSDVLNFHEYADVTRLGEVLTRLKASGRPILCTEWMSRTLGS
ncbi:MAG: endo-1,4-beta-xylanase, partial [Armatimonadota bacterium]|nr:endo-1,4-beta-xylanase [Armatimonadota bacterium]